MFPVSVFVASEATQSHGQFRRKMKPIVVAFNIILAVAFLVYVYRFSVIEHFTNSEPIPVTNQKLEIPNIVHFVYLVRDEPTVEGYSSNISFWNFIAIYSAYYHLKPDKIYVHTNIDVGSIKHEFASSNVSHLQALAQLDIIEFKHHDLPQKTTVGLEIENLAHRSDFIRTSILREHGGIYLDSDIYILRSFDSLRQSGFRNIFGQQQDGTAANGMIMTTPGSDLITAFDMLQDGIFDGEWTTHSIKLLTALARDFSSRQGEVLSLPKEAIYPVGWGQADIADFYRVNNFSRTSDGIDLGCQESSTGNVTDYVRRFLTRTDPVREKQFWGTSFCESFAVHGWSSAIARMIKDGFLAEFGGINVEYVLARRSHFARAVYPAVKHAIDTGVLEHKSFATKRGD